MNNYEKERRLDMAKSEIITGICILFVAVVGGLFFLYVSMETNSLPLRYLAIFCFVLAPASFFDISRGLAWLRELREEEEKSK